MMTHVQKTLKSFLFAATMLATAAGAHAQTPPAFGHWEGAINSPIGSQDFVIDLGAGEGGKPIGELSIAAEGVSGLPLRNVTIAGDAVSFELPGGDGKFSGKVAGDTFSGMMDRRLGSADFSMTRKGEARFAPEPVNAAIDKRFEGEWTGALDLQGRKAEARVALSNRPGKGAVGRLTVDGGVAIPLGIVQSGDKLTLDIVSARETLEVVLGANGELAGEYINMGGRTPFVLKRAAPQGALRSR
jgi:hypothetical protein